MKQYDLFMILKKIYENQGELLEVFDKDSAKFKRITDSMSDTLIQMSEIEEDARKEVTVLFDAILDNIELSAKNYKTLTTMCDDILGSIKLF